MAKFKIEDIQPNPFRHMERYPIAKEKVEELRVSFRETGFWKNIVARLNEDGKPEIAYGHHRLEALTLEYNEGTKVDLIVEDLSDEHMIKIMADENMDVWGSDFSVVLETINSVVQAYADGKILLDEPQGRKESWRYAPFFVQGDIPDHGLRCPYTAGTIAKFLGWWENRDEGRPAAKINVALGILEFIEQDTFTRDEFIGLGTLAARKKLISARKALRGGGDPKESQPRNLNEEAVRYAQEINNFILPNNEKLVEFLNALELTPDVRRELWGVLLNVSERAGVWATRFQADIIDEGIVDAEIVEDTRRELTA